MKGVGRIDLAEDKGRGGSSWKR